MQQNYYDLLEVSPSATLAEIRRSYHRLARLHHPDLNKQALDTHIKHLNLAYQTLRDPHKRAIYDEQPWIHMILVPRTEIREAIRA